MLKPEIEEFARLLVREIRDRSIVSCDSQVTTKSTSPIALRWRKYLETDSSSQLANSIIPDCIDDAIFHLLNAIDTGVLSLSFKSSTGEVIDLTTEGEGELGGWYMMGEDGWRWKYSEQRFFDDLKDLG